MADRNPFAFLENSTAQALLGTASAATVGPGFLSEALALAPSAPQLIGEALQKVSIGNTLADAFGAGKQMLQDFSQQQPSQQQSTPQSPQQPARPSQPQSSRQQPPQQQSSQQQQSSVRAEWRQWFNTPRTRAQLNQAQSILQSRGLFDEEMRELWNAAVANAPQ